MATATFHLRFCIDLIFNDFENSLPQSDMTNLVKGLTEARSNLNSVTLCFSTIDLIFKIALRFMPKPEDGAQTSIYLATSPEVKDTTGQFYGYQKNIEKPDTKHFSIENENMVWMHSMTLLEPYL
ncbi:hypothetical protein [Pseudochryseolinea flava]|nr:hypothetical protein [Pseudochryseolinea flava]